ncbi:MAG: HAMP domain-containing protein [Burkholderiales bacterium]|nr:HAMP domain-containing protein [Burkholderiales bacterium]
MRRLFADTLFNRLFGLAMAAVITSHVATFALLFIFLGDHRPPPPAKMHGGIPPDPGLLSGPFIGFVASMSLQLLLLAYAIWIGSRSLARPVQELAAAARQFGENQPPQQLRESGPEETRSAAQVFNHMQMRIHKQIEEKERFLAAVSHDLRTPLTRMKLRLEQLSDESAQEYLLRDIDEMRNMLDATLDYLRGSSEAFQLLDMQSLLESIVDNMHDEGKTVSISGSCFPINAMPNEMRRCICNLLENAIFYGQTADIQLIDSTTELHIRISDQGPGIPEADLEKVFDPFYRRIQSRNKNSGGVGLGLSIAREVARQHRGSLHLENKCDANGLIALLCLPRNS